METNRKAKAKANQSYLNAYREQAKAEGTNTSNRACKSRQWHTKTRCANIARPKRNAPQPHQRQPRTNNARHMSIKQELKQENISVKANAVNKLCYVN